MSNTTQIPPIPLQSHASPLSSFQVHYISLFHKVKKKKTSIFVFFYLLLMSTHKYSRKWMPDLISLIFKTVTHYQPPADVQKKMDRCNLSTKTWNCEVVVCNETVMWCDEPLGAPIPSTGWNVLLGFSCVTFVFILVFQNVKSYVVKNNL